MVDCALAFDGQILGKMVDVADQANLLFVLLLQIVQVFLPREAACEYQSKILDLGLLFSLLFSAKQLKNPIIYTLEIHT